MDSGILKPERGKKPGGWIQAQGPKGSQGHRGPCNTASYKVIVYIYWWKTTQNDHKLMQRDTKHDKINTKQSVSQQSLSLGVLLLCRRGGGLLHVWWAVLFQEESFSSLPVEVKRKHSWVLTGDKKSCDLMVCVHQLTSSVFRLFFLTVWTEPLRLTCLSADLISSTKPNDHLSHKAALFRNYLKD